jgi:hypothetical protein
LLTGGNGGNGGRGGAGGDGGAGAGGPSASIFSGGSSVYALRESTTQFGTAGAGGFHGGGPQAQGGVAAATLPANSTPSTSSDFYRDGVSDADDECLSSPGTGADGCGADTTPPVASITGGPNDGAVTTSRVAEFSFNANESSSFFCKLDDAASFEPCSSPQRYTDLADG